MLAMATVFTVDSALITLAKTKRVSIMTDDNFHRVTASEMEFEKVDDEMFLRASDHSQRSASVHTGFAFSEPKGFELLPL